MKTRKLMAALVAAITALSIGATVFAADRIKSQTGTKTRIKDGSCR